MILRGEELELLRAIVGGSFETPLWGEFLDRMREMTGAQFAVLNFRPPRRPFAESVNLISGAPQASIDEANLARFPSLEPPMIEALIEGHPYALEELRAIDTSPPMLAYADYLARMGVTTVMQMRIQEASGVHAWLSIIRSDGQVFTLSDESLLRTIAPFLRIALQHHVALERERYGASLTAQAVRGLFGWIALDRTGQVLDHDEQGASVLVESGILGKTSSGRLTARPATLLRDIHQALERLGQDPHARPRAITLSQDPWLDMLLVPARRKSISAKATPDAIAYVHGDIWHSADRQEQLAQLFGLSPGEARLALALCQGMTIAEAASSFGLAVGTARNYSKSIFAKTGARGQVDLVRIVMRSVLAIAPGV